MGAKTPNRGSGKNVDPGLSFAAVTKSDSTEVNARGVYVGTGGDLALANTVGTAVTFKNVASGTYLPVFAWKIMSTNTTASDIVALDVLP